MAAPDEFYLEMPFGVTVQDTYDRDVLDTDGRNVLDCDWGDVQDDVLTESPIVIFQGSRNGDPLDRVSDAGTIKFVMDNSASNSGGLVGYYSPDSQNKRTGFALGTLVRVGLLKDASTEWLAQGRIISIEPQPGLLAEKRVDVTVGDWLEVASRTPMPRIPVQESVTDDQVIQSIVTALGDDAPFELDLDVGAYTYTHALTDVDDELTLVASALQTLAQCGVARIFITGGTTSGEILRYVSLYNLLSVNEPVASFVNDFMESSAKRESRRRVKRVVVSAQPFTTNVDAELFSISSEISIAAGERFEIIGIYRDENASSSSSIPAKNVITPVVGTDFNFSSVSGSGSDLNADLVIDEFEVGARSFKVAGINNSVVPGFLWQFKVRGDALLPYQSIDYTAVNATIPEREAVTLNYDLPYHDTYSSAAEIAEALNGWYSVEATRLPFIEFCPSLDEDSFSRFLVSKPGEAIAVTESVTGTSQITTVLGREIRIWNGGKYIMERLFITPALQVESGLYFTLDTPGQDELDGDNAILAFGS